MAIITCRECNEEVSSEAKTCPRCGIKKPKPKESLSILNVISLIFLVFIGYSFINKPDNTSTLKYAYDLVSFNTSSKQPDEKIRTIEQVKQSCESGKGRDCDLLGAAYKWGNGAHIQGFKEKDEVKSIQYFQKAFEYHKKDCKLNKGADCLFAGGYYRDDFKGVFKKDYFKAGEYFQKACALNIGSGCFIRGAYYEKGLGVKPNKQKAAKYYQKGCDLKDWGSCSKLKNLN